jgi:hypothetical protein
LDERRRPSGRASSRDAPGQRPDGLELVEQAARAIELPELIMPADDEAVVRAALLNRARCAAEWRALRC